MRERKTTRINQVATLGGILLLASLFLPWTTGAAWWLHTHGRLYQLLLESVHQLALQEGALLTMRTFQLLGVIQCFIFLLAGGVLALLQRKWMAQLAAVMTLGSLFFYTFVSLEALWAISAPSIGIGYLLAWPGVILIGMGGELPPPE